MSETSALTEIVENHLALLIKDKARWLQLIDDAFVWEFPYAQSLGLPPKVEGREQVRHFLERLTGDLEDLQFGRPQIYPSTDHSSAAVEVSAIARFRGTGRTLAQDYVLFLELHEGRIARIREYFDPLRLARGLGLTPK